jgi:hypothetical protein
MTDRVTKRELNFAALLVVELMAEGTMDPSAEDIARRSSRDDTPDDVLKGLADYYRKILRKGLIKLLREEQHQRIVPVSARYYTRYRRRPPRTLSEAKECLTTYGRSGGTHGLYAVTMMDDLIWEAEEWSKGKRSARALHNTMAELAEGHEAGLVSRDGLLDLEDLLRGALDLGPDSAIILDLQIRDLENPDDPDEDGEDGEDGEAAL